MSDLNVTTTHQKMRFKTMKKEIREEMLNKTFAVGSAGKVSREEWITVRSHA